MKKKPDIPPKTELRSLAKPKLSKPKKTNQPQDQADVLRLIHELQTQNEELTKTRAEVEKAYRQYTDLYDFAPVGYFTLARDGTILEVNLAGANLLGAGAERVKLINRRLGLFVAKESRPIFNTFLEGLLSCEGKTTCELAFEKKRGGVLWARLEATCFEGGEICRAALMDITERRQMELTLKESEKRFRMLLQDIPSVAVQGYATDGTIQYWNSASEKFYGYSAQEAIGQNLLELIIPPEMRSEVWQAILQMTESEQPIPAAELSLMGKGGSRVSVYSSHAIVSMPGHAPELFCFDVDLTERKRAEEALKESEWRNRIVSELTTDYIFVVDVDPGGLLKFRWASENLFRITGRTIEEVATSDTWGSIIHPDDRGRFFDFIAQILSTAETGELECRTFYKDGEERWVRIFARPQSGEDHVVTTIIGAIQDITERMRAGQRLQQSEERFRLLFEKAPLGYQALDENGRVMDVNQAWLGTLGYAREEVLGKWFGDFLAPEYVDAFRERFPIFKGAGQIHSEFEMLHRNGSRHWIAFDGRIGYELNGSIKQTHCILQDITERRRAEIALKDSEFFIKSVLNSLNGHIAVLDKTAVIMAVNEAWRKFAQENGSHDSTGYVGVNYLEVCQAAIRQGDAVALQVDQGIRAVMNQSQTEFSMEYQCNSPGEQRWFMVTVLPMSESHTGLVVIHQDITERKQAEMELQHMKAVLEKANIELHSALTLQQQLAHTDMLTGINNRRHLYELAEHELDIALRYRQSLAVMMFDLDHFKMVNDTFGHMSGDQILQLVTQAASVELRSADVIGRYGGEEFVIVLPMTNAQQAYPLAERIRKRVETMRVPTEKGDAAVTLSIGIVEIRHDAEAETAEDLIRRADEAMYAAKQAGRNQTMIR